MLLTAVAYFMVTLKSFGGGIATLKWTVSAYTIAFSAGILTAAALGDRLGRRRIYVGPLKAGAALQPNEPSFGIAHSADQLLSLPWPEASCE